MYLGSVVHLVARLGTACKGSETMDAARRVLLARVVRAPLACSAYLGLTAVWTQSSSVRITSSPSPAAAVAWP